MTRALAAAVLCVAALACGKQAAPPAATPAVAGVQDFGDPPHKHVTGPVTYPQTPPVGGPHNPVWLRCGVYDRPVPNEHAVHSLEHRAAWITYRPDLPADDVTTLRRLQALKPDFVLISPYPGLPTPVVASAWGRQLRVERADDPRLAEFVRTYAGGTTGGVEPTAPCVQAGRTPDDVRADDARAGIAPPS